MADGLLDDKKYGGIAAPAEISEDYAIGVDDASAIPKGTIDPVYEAKARVLNRAVWWSPRRCRSTDLLARFKILAWDGINGSYSSLSGLVGLATIYGRSSLRSFVGCPLPTHQRQELMLRQSLPSTTNLTLLEPLSLR